MWAQEQARALIITAPDPEMGLQRALATDLAQPSCEYSSGAQGEEILQLLQQSCKLS